MGLECRWDAISWLWWRWDVKWIEVRCEYEHLHGGETWMQVRQYIEVVKTESWDLDPVEEGPGWKWGTHLETCIGLRWCLDGTKMQFGGPGWRWDEIIEIWGKINVSHSCKSQLILIWVLLFASYFHPGYAPPPPPPLNPDLKMYVLFPFSLTCMHVPGFLSHLHPCIISPPYRPKNSSLTVIHITAHLHASPISPKSRSKYESQLQPRPISSPFRPIA